MSQKRYKPEEIIHKLWSQK